MKNISFAVKNQHKMSSLYPSLEDMQVHKMVQAQQNAFASQVNAQPMPTYAEGAYPQLGAPAPYSYTAPASASAPLYPGLDDFMGLQLTSDVLALNFPEYTRNTETAVMPSKTGMIAPLSNQTAGYQRAQVTHGIREVTVCKGTDQKIGLRVKDINNGIFITLVCKDSPAALVGYVFFCNFTKNNFVKTYFSLISIDFVLVINFCKSMELMSLATAWTKYTKS